MREPCGCPQKPSLHWDRRVRESTKASVPSSFMLEKWKQTVTTRKLIKIHKTVEGEKPTKNEVFDLKCLLLLCVFLGPGFCFHRSVGSVEDTLA